MDIILFPPNLQYSLNFESKDKMINIINIPIMDNSLRNSSKIIIPQKIEKTNAEYSKGATRPAKLNL